MMIAPRRDGGTIVTTTASERDHEDQAIPTRRVRFRENDHRRLDTDTLAPYHGAAARQTWARTAVLVARHRSRIERRCRIPSDGGATLAPRIRIAICLFVTATSFAPDRLGGCDTGSRPPVSRTHPHALPVVAEQKLERADSRSPPVAQRGCPARSRARRFVNADFARFDLVIALDADNLRRLRALATNDEALEKLRLLREFDTHGGGPHDVPDPWYGGADGFEEVLDLCERACNGLLAHLQRETSVARAAEHRG